MKHPSRKTMWTSALAAMSLSLVTPALAEAECDDAAAALRSALAGNRGDLLVQLAKAIAARESCSCELVKAAIALAGADRAQVGDIVFTAVSVAPAMATTITECAVAAAPKATSEIKAALKSALSDKGPAAYGKESHDKNPAPAADDQGFESGRPPLDPRGVYIADPMSNNPFPGDSDGDGYAFGVSPQDIRGIYLVAPTGGGGPSEDALRRQRQEARRVIEKITTIVRTYRYPSGNPGVPGGGGGGGGEEITPSNPIPVVEKRTVEVKGKAKDDEPVISSSSSVGSEEVLAFSSPAAGKSAAGGAGSSIIGTVTLSPAQMEIARARAQKEFDRLVEKELESMGTESGKSVIPPRSRQEGPGADASRSSVRAETEKKIAEVREKAATRRSTATAPEQQKQIDAEEGRSIYQLEQQAAKEEAAFDSVVADTPYEIAVQRVREKYGTSIAVPIAEADAPNVVAFASVNAQGIVSVARTAYELDRDPSLDAEPKGDILAAAIENKEHILALAPAQ